MDWLPLCPGGDFFLVRGGSVYRLERRRERGGTNGENREGRVRRTGLPGINRAIPRNFHVETAGDTKDEKLAMVSVANAAGSFSFQPCRVLGLAYSDNRSEAIDTSWKARSFHGTLALLFHAFAGPCPLCGLFRGLCQVAQESARRNGTR